VVRQAECYLRILIMRASLAGILWVLWIQANSCSAAFYYVSPTGLDTNPGTSNSPFATIMRGQAAAGSGDTVFLRGGTYFLNSSHLTATNNPWAIVNNINKSGISYVAVPGERPIFNFSAVQPAGFRVTAFLVSANNCVFKGFDVVGVQVTITGTHTQSENFRVTGSRNRFEHLVMRDGMANGWYLTGGSSNLVLNCDAYNNRGLDSGSIGNVDGFGVHPSNTSGRGNVIRGCRAWFNSDDGYDCINADAAVVFENCWAFYNGYTTNFSNSGGDGNGFKSGGYGRNGSSFPTPVPRHVTRFCLAVRNRVAGFYANHHTGGLDWVSNTAYRNNVNYNMLCTLSDNLTDVPGYDHLMKNNLGFRGNTEVSNLGATNDTTFNYFTLPVTVSSNDFMTLDENLLMAPRKPNGDLPYIAFAQLVGGSDLKDAGTNAGFSFAGVAPDLGAFEYSIQPAPALVIETDGFRITFTGEGGPAGGTNRLLTEVDASLPLSQWAAVATNKFDSSGNVTFTNLISGDVEKRFYRLVHQ
jgi:hypothetical protein